MNEWSFSPVMFQIGPFQAHWYGFMYALGFAIGYLYLMFSKRGKTLKPDERDSLVLHVILGVVLGGRIGYILIYNLAYYLENPAKLLAVWEGGMSFHGGLIGVAIAVWLFRKKYKKTYLQIGDIICSIAPVGLFFAKIGNFINAELYGRIVQISEPYRHFGNHPAFVNLQDSLCVYFPTDPSNCRYPSQLLEALLEGIVLFIIVTLVSRKFEKQGVVAGTFLVCYGIFRIFIEFFREPDPQIGFLPGGITMGQLLSIIMVISGLLIFWQINKSVHAKSKK
jgi:phosphatidylglycerol:prolipoprotein diacylglycerol transferase